MKFKGITIRQRLMSVILLTSGAVLTLSCIAYFTYDYRSFQQAIIRNLTTLGDMIAANSTAALAFENKQDAKEILNMLHADKHIVAACLYDKEGKLFSAYSNGLSPKKFPALPAPDGYRFTNGRLQGFQPISLGPKRLGTLYLSANMDEMYSRLRLYAIIVGVMILISYLLAYLLSGRLRETILKPIFSLAEAAKIVSERGDYSTRAEKYVDDELGLLTDAFNNMLAKIEVQNEEIKSFNALLERKVSERTIELELANNVLKDQKEFVETIINSSVDMIAVFNTNLEFVIVNNHAEHAYRLSREAMVGKHVLELFPSVKNSGMYNDLVRACNGEAVHQSKYWSPVLKRYFENFYIPLKDAKDNVYGILTIGHDITEIIQASEQMKIVNNELVKSNLELEQFAYIASHDLQEPLRKIRVFSELVERNINDPEEGEKYLAKIKSSAKSMTDLIKAVLNYSQLSRNEESVSVDLNTVLENIMIELELIIAEKGAQINSDILPTIRGIPFQLKQLFSSLLGNSLKFSEKRPMINISCDTINGSEINRKLKNLGEPLLQLNANQHYFVLVFKDNGIGFEPQYTPQVFTIFKRLHGREQYPGTGIGLALVKKIVENHNGIITVKSQPGEGTLFHIYLPADK